MSNTTIPAVVRKLRAADTGVWDAFMEDFSTEDLKVAYEWAFGTDDNLLCLIEDELQYRGVI